MALCLGLATGALGAETSPVHLTDAQDLVSTGDLNPEAETRSQANALYAQALRESPDNPPATALALLRQVVQLDPHFPDASLRIANLLFQAGQYDDAILELQSAYANNPGSIELEATLGYARHLHGQSDEAWKLCSDVLTKKPGQSIAMRVVLEIAADRKTLPAALHQIEEQLRKAGAAVPAATWLTLARAYADTVGLANRSSDSREVRTTLLSLYQQAAAKPPPEIETLTLLADTYSDLGRKPEALKTLQQASALDPSDVDLIIRCANLEMAQGQGKEALRSYETAYALNPGFSGLREKLGRLYLDLGRFADAARLLEQAFADAPDSPSLGLDLGFAYEGANQPEKAQACFLQVLQALSSPPEAYLKLAVHQMSREEMSAASSTLAAAQKRFPLSPKIRFCQAVVHRYEKNYEAAITSLEEMRVLSSGPDGPVLDLGYYTESALTLTLANKKELIEPMLKEGLARFPDNADLMNELAYSWADEAVHLPEALALARRAMATDPNNGPLQDTLGWIYFQMGEAKDALPYLQRAAVLTNNDPVVLQHLGDTYLKLGRRSEALAAWRHGLEKAPRNGDLANRIDAALAQAKNAHPRSAPTP